MNSLARCRTNERFLAQTMLLDLVQIAVYYPIYRTQGAFLTESDFTRDVDKKTKH